MTIPKNWKDEPDTSTPVNAAALKDLEERVHDAAVITAVEQVEASLPEFGEDEVIVKTIGSELAAARPEAKSVIWVATGQPENATASDIVILEGGLKRRVPYTWQWDSDVEAGTNKGFWVPVLAGESCKLVKMFAEIASGTSIKIALTKNGSEIEGFKGKEAKTTAVTATGEVEFKDEERLGVIRSSPSGSPKGLTVTVWLEYTR